MSNKSTWAAALTIAVLLPAGTACTDQTSEWEAGMNQTQPVSIETRSAEAEIGHPMTLYAFDSDTETLVTSTTGTSSTDKSELKLTKGHYTLVALASTGSLSVPETPTLSSTIGVPDDGIIDTAPQMAISPIEVKLP